jgi:hypothetical protein
MQELELRDFVQMQIDKEEGGEDNSQDESQEKETIVDDGRPYPEDNFDYEEDDEVDETHETEGESESDEEEGLEAEQPEADSVEDEKPKSIDYENQYKELLPDYTKKSQRVKELEQYLDDYRYLVNNPKELKRYLDDNNIDLNEFAEKPIEQPMVPEVTEFETETERLLYQRAKSQEDQISNLSGQLKQMNNTISKFENYMADENTKSYFASLRSEFLEKAKAEGISPERLHTFHAYMDSGSRLNKNYTADDAIARIKKDMGIDNVSVEDVLAKDKKLNEKLKQKYIDEYISEKEKTRRETTSLSSVKTSNREPISKKKRTRIVDVESALLAAAEDGAI